MGIGIGSNPLVDALTQLYGVGNVSLPADFSRFYGNLGVNKTSGYPPDKSGAPPAAWNMGPFTYAAQPGGHNLNVTAEVPPLPSPPPLTIPASFRQPAPIPALQAIDAATAPRIQGQEMYGPSPGVPGFSAMPHNVRPGNLPPAPMGSPLLQATAGAPLPPMPNLHRTPGAPPPRPTAGLMGWLGPNIMAGMARPPAGPPAAAGAPPQTAGGATMNGRPFTLADLFAGINATKRINDPTWVGNQPTAETLSGGVSQDYNRLAANSGPWRDTNGQWHG